MGDAAHVPSVPQRMTRQRGDILAALDATGGFRSAQEWHETLRHSGAAIGLATVYRALQSLADSGLVDTVRGEDGEALYRRCGDTGGHHHHLRCRNCGAAEEVEGPGVEAWAAGVAVRHGYASIEHTIELTGVCGPCASRAAR